MQTGSGTLTAGNLGTALGSGAATTTPIGSLMVCTTNLPDKIAISVDSQMDDGVGTTGTVRAAKQSQPNPSTIASVAEAYTEDGVSQYVVCKMM